MPTLAVYALSDSFAAVWPALAVDCGFDYALVDEPASFARLGGAVALLSAGGVEHSLEPLVRQLAGGALTIVAIGAEADHRLASALTRAGAAEYFALPQDEDVLRSWLKERSARFRSLTDRARFAQTERGKYRFDEILGDSPALRSAIDRAARVIPHAGVTVLITGETGTGKELIARAIHYNGPRQEAPFVDINCAAIPAALLESELFGHEKGAFTGATASKPGLFEIANGGTLFLDEIGDLPLELQGKLLRALEERVVRRVGGTRSVPVDVRVIAATHVDLVARANRGEFREDLYYRLDVVSIELPSLRSRRDDIEPLARHFLSKIAAQYGLQVPHLERRGPDAAPVAGLAGQRARTAQRHRAGVDPLGRRRTPAGRLPDGAHAHAGARGDRVPGHDEGDHAQRVPSNAGPLRREQERGGAPPRDLPVTIDAAARPGRLP